jgi:hypothetical protein
MKIGAQNIISFSMKKFNPILFYSMHRIPTLKFPTPFFQVLEIHDASKLLAQSPCSHKLSADNSCRTRPKLALP